MQSWQLMQLEGLRSVGDASEMVRSATGPQRDTKVCDSFSMPASWMLQQHIDLKWMTFEKSCAWDESSLYVCMQTRSWFKLSILFFIKLCSPDRMSILRSQAQD